MILRLFLLFLFQTSWNLTGVLHLKRMPVLVTVLSVSISEDQDSILPCNFLHGAEFLKHK